VVVSRRENLLFACLALVGAFVIARGIVAGPGFTDVFYHLNAANRLVNGQGLTDPYLWTYIGAPDTLPVPSHLYWMPLTSLSAAFGMWVLNAPGNYYAAQWPFALMFAGTVFIGFWLGGQLGGTRRHAWIAGLLTLFSGFYTRFWGAIDTFAPYAFVGSLGLVFLWMLFAPDKQAGTGKITNRYVYAAGAGVCAGLAHLTRADGVLLLLVGLAVVLWGSRPSPPNPLSLSARGKDTPPSNSFPVPEKGNKVDSGSKMTQNGVWTIGNRAGLMAVMMLAYGLTMTPWFIRNLNAIGTPMPLGGTQAIWFREYDDIFSYPPDASPSTLFADGVGAFVDSRWLALTNNLGTLIAVEGLVIMTPLMLIGLWRRRGDVRLRAFWLYALGVHLAMTFVFPFPGYRGGLLHSATALVPFWAALGVVGLDDCVDWIAKRRRQWNAATAKWLFSVALVGFAVFLSYSIGTRNMVPPITTPGLYRELTAVVPADARVMINDPAQLYTFTGLSGVVLPNEAPDAIVEIARKYDVRYLLIEGVTADGTSSVAASPELWPLLSNPPDFLKPIPFTPSGTRLYEIVY